MLAPALLPLTPRDRSLLIAACVAHKRTCEREANEAAKSRVVHVENILRRDARDLAALIERIKELA